ncbi:VOC family protein [Sporosarcina pasteurii]|uniref:Glyoxalase-like domain-containing protein n=1 Tax=Sporosarcina pasteurii TaxID=1474 RepID=A0A380CKB1_SPOPA|nr:VOC family protein [Sporosarcina pasteurii]MDS9472110.1 VOC family protein [Sporosarcina pasteurii]QBQ06827.1 VOC family protein [Sporosarcina pasteurii]SUJ20763.1 Uncharacterised protein [Sporosarcina pasteurii]
MKLDHVVYFTKKSPVDVVEEQQRLGWHAVIGGRHEKWGTHNTLMYLSNAYIEWLSVEQETIAQNSKQPLVKLLLHDLADGENWGTVCFSVNDIAKFNEELNEKGYETSGVLDAERKTVHGDVRKWKMLFIQEAPSNTLPYPFFIEWQADEEIRFKELRTDGTLLPDNEKLEVTECLFSVENPNEITENWASLLGIELRDNTMLRLPNCNLKFIEKSARETRERLIDVAIQHR